jgi:hypothetical protein
MSHLILGFVDIPEYVIHLVDGTAVKDVLPFRMLSAPMLAALVCLTLMLPDSHLTLTVSTDLVMGPSGECVSLDVIPFPYSIHPTASVV